ncbi:MAG: bifunctional glutamate N-acetyltransferase/amino-acid acetyltransferase ArgJ [Candidatus Rokubacteria bacterium]|nr:bifunctional glutamate N-acetyltransferase/amino-acid acetyltransferase ArgJ [Candidatus Rokubacteria bacterium]
MPELEWFDGGITAVPGILAGGVTAGIKPSGKKDLALVYSSSPARAAAVFTSNQVKGAPVLVSMQHVRGGVAQAIVASSGCANVCTGEQGMRDAREMTRLVSEALRIRAEHVLIASTGVIGERLPMDKIRAAIPTLVKSLSPQGGRTANEAIMTTDTRLKEVAARLEIGGRPVTIGGMAKGAAMIEPHLATMLCFVATDAAITREALDASTRRAVDASFNRITIDSDQSTSDTVFVLANGLSENDPLGPGARGLTQFSRALAAVMQRLARLMVQDGEGATKLVAISVRGAASRRDALAAARSIANSPLVKTAINGEDPNWGRLMMAIGKSPARVDAGRVAIAFEGELMVEGGTVKDGVRVDRIREIMRRSEYTITVDLGLGRAEDTVWTCDLSEEYVRLNSKYTT